MKKIGIIGGTFDPVHYGHLILAEQARVEAELDKVIFMPAMVQPFKLNEKITSGDHRYAMLLKAVSGNPYFSVSRRELDSPKISKEPPSITSKIPPMTVFSPPCSV
jgi:nicotinate-nucleotide adenylyltransferase